MDIKKTEEAVTAVLFACGEPMGIDKLSEILETDKNTLTKILLGVKDKLEGTGVVLLRLGDEYQLSSDPEYADYVKTALDKRRNAPLSAAAMEVLSIIAYNQPVTKSFVEQIRGVSSSEVVSGLCEKGLVEEAGRLDLPGRPVSYKTTANFLRCFGLESLSDLPSVEQLQVKRDEEMNVSASAVLLGEKDQGEDDYE